jgi:nicotinamide mononucleotide transporter
MDLLNFVEIAGVAFGFWSVWLTVKEKVLCWPVGIVNILLFMVMFYWVKLYADLGLQFFFLILSIYGWWVWIHPTPGKKDVPVTLMTQPLRAGTFAVSAAATLLVGSMLGTYTDASVPYWDSMTTVMSVAAQYLMARKKLECWTIWITADVFDIGIYVYKGLYLTSGLYVAFLILATTGLIAWWRSWKRTNTV